MVWQHMALSSVAVKVAKRITSLIHCKGSVRTRLHGLVRDVPAYFHICLIFTFQETAAKGYVLHLLLKLRGFFDLLGYTPSEDTRLSKKENISIVTELINSSTFFRAWHYRGARATDRPKEKGMEMASPGPTDIFVLVRAILRNKDVSPLTSTFFSSEWVVEKSFSGDIHLDFVKGNYSYYRTAKTCIKRIRQKCV